MIDAIDLTKIYQDQKRGEVVAAQNITFRAEKGSILGLLGPNGAGKTTTLRMLSTVIKPTSGTACVAGHSILDEPEKVRQHIGFLSGDTGLYHRLSPEEMILYFGRLYDMEEQRLQQRMNELFKLLQMDNFRTSKIDKLSSGMKQKVNIARTLLHDPPVLILDEPTTGLDVITSRTIIDSILYSKEQNKCVIFSTHIMSEAERLCDQIAIIHKGKIYFIGTTEALKESTGKKTLEDAFLALVEENGYEPS